MPTWRQRTFELAGRIRDHPGRWFIAAILVTVVAVVGLIEVFRPGAFSPDPPLSIGEAGVTGPFAVTIRDVSCGRDEGDLPPSIRDLPVNEGGPLPAKGQFCFVETNIRNSDNAATPVVALVPVLWVDDEEYVFAMGYDPESTDAFNPVLFPDEAMQYTIIFDIPEESDPTKVTFQFPERDVVTFAL